MTPVLLIVLLALTSSPPDLQTPTGPYDRQVSEWRSKLGAETATVRAGAAEALGFLRAYAAEPALIERLGDESPDVRRQAALALAWCGGRASVAPLLDCLGDRDWLVRQAAHVSLTNLTGMELPFNGLAAPGVRGAQTRRWQQWWTTVPTDRPPAEALELVLSASALGRCNAVKGRVAAPSVATDWWKVERGLRALGALGGRGANEAVLACLGDSPPTMPAARPAVRAGIRALGRLRQEAGFQALIGWLGNTMWARCAAEALGDFGDPRALRPLLLVYPRYAKQLDGKAAPQVPADDNWAASPADAGEDRMLETPFWISYALCRLSWQDSAARAELRRLAPLILANLPRDHDRSMLYEPAGHDLLTRHLLEVSGLRQEACEHAFELLGQPRRVPEPDDDPVWPVEPGPAPWQDKKVSRTAACISTWLPVLCNDRQDVPRLQALLEHPDGWVRINAAKTLAWLGDRRAVEPLAQLLADSPAEADFGYCGTFKFDEYNDPAPRWREALIRALGLLQAREHTSLIAPILADERSTLGVRCAAAQALADLLDGGNNALAQAVLSQAAVNHPFHSIRHVARDALRVRGIRPSVASRVGRSGDLPTTGDSLWDGLPTVPRVRPQVSESVPELMGSASRQRTDLPETKELERTFRHVRAVTQEPKPYPTASPSDNHSSSLPTILFIKGENVLPNDVGTVELADRWHRTYVYTDTGPAHRPGRNFYLLHPDHRVAPLTHFSDGYVADPEISWDATRIVFTRRGQEDPWWHVWQINVDGSGLRQLTNGPYHDVGPAWLPDGRIVCSSTRNGTRDEYHSYPCNALYVMNADGSRLEPIAVNVGRDNEPTVLPDGRIAFCRLEAFYARIKTEQTLHAVHADGSRDVVLYGPERRAFWHQLDYGLRSRIGRVEQPLMFGVLRLTQPQPMPDGRSVVLVTQGGLALVDGRRDQETIITPDNKTRAYTTAFPLPDGRVLCAATSKVLDYPKIDLGLYVLDPATTQVELLYNDPAAADFEPRPVLARRPPVVLATDVQAGSYSGRFVCASVFTTQLEEVRQRGRLVRLVEGVPVVTRHSTHTNPWPIWKNHHGTLARVLGTVPLAPDGSFHLEVPADRLLHLQVLDSDRRVVGNQLTWISPRPGERKSCVGCHEHPHSAPTLDHNALALRQPPLALLPHGDELSYRAKSWSKGTLAPEVEERMRTVRAVNLLGR